MAELAAEHRWLIAIDIDGTLVHDDGYLSPAVVEQVQRVRDAGARCSIGVRLRLRSLDLAAHDFQAGTKGMVE